MIMMMLVYVFSFFAGFPRFVCLFVWFVFCHIGSAISRFSALYVGCFARTTRNGLQLTIVTHKPVSHALLR